MSWNYTAKQPLVHLGNVHSGTCRPADSRARIIPGHVEGLLLQKYVLALLRAPGKTSSQEQRGCDESVSLSVSHTAAL